MFTGDYDTREVPPLVICLFFTTGQVAIKTHTFIASRKSGKERTCGGAAIWALLRTDQKLKLAGSRGRLISRGGITFT